MVLHPHMPKDIKPVMKKAPPSKDTSRKVKGSSHIPKTKVKKDGKKR